MKKQKPKTAAKKRQDKRKAKAKAETKEERRSWVLDRLAWVPVDQHHHHHRRHHLDISINDGDGEADGDPNVVKTKAGRVVKEVAVNILDKEEGNTISIISWNVLADAYCNRSSHKNLPLKFQRRIFDRKQRRYHVQQTLWLLTNKNDDNNNERKLALRPDLLALQEVDPPLGVAACLQEQGYGAVETATTKGGRVGRVDACGLYYRQQAWACLHHETVFLDDLATNGHALASTSNCNSMDNKEVDPTAMGSNLRGLQTSFMRKNVALLVKLQHKPSGRTLVVVVAHLFWNPAYEYVKLCQTHYVAQRARAFCIGEDLPILFCGDFNSQPRSQVHRFLVEGKVNAKLSAPWYAYSRSQSEGAIESSELVKKQGDGNNEVELENSGMADVEDKFRNLNLGKDMVEAKCNRGAATPTIRYILDFTLNRFCRWLRILGLDAAMETEQEEIKRTKEGNVSVFDRCIQECRTLVTTSSKLLKRKDCPPGTYLVDSKSRSNLEETLVHLLLSHGVTLEPAKTLSRCVVCNGSIVEVHNDEKRKQIFKLQQAPDELIDQALDVYECDGCGQGYWWCEKPTSSASRVKSQATRLLEICIAGGVPVSDDLGMFDACIDVQKIRSGDETIGTATSSWANERLDVVEWLQTENLENSLNAMTSVYASPDDGAESLPFTNVTSDFVGHLDYILYQKEKLHVRDLLYVPTTFEELNDFGFPNGHLLPSFDWPSDHLAIGARLAFNSNGKVDSGDSCVTKIPGEKEYPNVLLGGSVEEEKKDGSEVDASLSSSPRPLNEEAHNV